MRVAIVNGPNLNMLGVREPSMYGAVSFDDLQRMCGQWADDLGVDMQWYQSNAEGAIVDTIQSLHGSADAIVINAGAYSHTSIAVRDAVLAVDIPVYEVHISNIYARDAFRHHSYISDIAVGVICGFGVWGYKYALCHIVHTQT